MENEIVKKVKRELVIYNEDNMFRDMVERWKAKDEVTNNIILHDRIDGEGSLLQAYHEKFPPVKCLFGSQRIPADIIEDLKKFYQEDDKLQNLYYEIEPTVAVDAKYNGNHTASWWAVKLVEGKVVILRNPEGECDGKGIFSRDQSTRKFTVEGELRFHDLDEELRNNIRSANSNYGCGYAIRVQPKTILTMDLIEQFFWFLVFTKKHSFGMWHYGHGIGVERDFYLS